MFNFCWASRHWGISSERRNQLAVAVLCTVFGCVTASAQQTWTWLGGTSDVAAPSNWSLSVPGNLPGPPGVTTGDQIGRIASFGSTGSTTLVQSSPDYWLEQFIFQPGASAYTYTGTDPAAYLSLAPVAAVDINAIDNRSTNVQIFNLPTGGKLGYDGFIKTTAGGGDVVVNGPVSVSDGSTDTARFSGVTGSGNVYFNVDTTVHPSGNVDGGVWTSANPNSSAYRNNRARFLTDGLSGRVYLGNIGTAYRGSFHLNSTAGGKVRLTHDNSLGDQGAFGGTGSGVTAVLIYGGNADVNPATGFNTTLELSNNINVRRAVMWLGPRAGATIGNTPHISNVSGNNTLTVGADWNTMGLTAWNDTKIDGNWNIESQAGNLTLAGGDNGGVIINYETTNLNLQLMGAGNGQIDVPILKWQTNPTVSIVKKGSGTWTLTNPNTAAFGAATFDGKVIVEQGTLALSGAGSLADASSIDIRSGASLNVTGVGGYTLNSLNALVTGAGTVTGNLTASFGNTIAPGDSGVGTFNVTGNLDLVGAALQYELTSNPLATNDKIAVVGDLNISGSATVNVLPINGSLGAGTYNLMTYTGNLIGDANSLTLAGATTSPRQSIALSSSTPQQINLVVTGSVATLTWVGGNNGNAWDNGITANNWTGAADNRFYDGDKVIFASTGTANPNIVGTVAPGQVDFTNGVGQNYTLTGGTLNVASHLTVNGAGNVTFANDTTAVSGNTTISGSGTVNFSNTTSFTSGGNFNATGAGTINLTSGAFNVPNVALSGGTFAINRIDDMLGSSAFTTSLAGSGTFVKKNVNTVEISGNHSAFSGTMVVEAGTLATRSTTALTDTTVQSGATLDLGSTTTGAAAPGGGTADITINGHGVGNLGALTVTTPGPNSSGNNAHIASLTLQGDSTIRAKSPAATSDLTNRAILWVDGPVNAQGHALNVIVDTSLGTATEIDFINSGAMNIGNLTLSGGGAFYIGGTSDIGASGTLTLGDAVANGDPTDNTPGRLGLYGNVTNGGGLTASISKPIVVTSAGGGIEQYLQNATPYTVSSTIALNGNLAVDLYTSAAATRNELRLSGVISGSGNLEVHALSAAAARRGIVTTTANNTYTGTTTIGGGDPDGANTIANGYTGVLPANDRITLNVNGTHTGGGDYQVNTSGTLGGTGSITSNVSVNSGGRINPGAGPGNSDSATAGVGTLTVGSALFNPDSTLLIEYDGAADTIDKLVVTGALDITSAILDFNNLGTGTLNGSPKIFASYGSLIGESFANILDPVADYTIDYNYLGTKQIALVGGPTIIPGDFNGDGNVNAADYVVWRKNPAGFPEDAYAVWRANFGPAVGAGSGAGLEGGAVPEPTVCGLLSMFALGILGRRRSTARKLRFIGW